MKSLRQIVMVGGLLLALVSLAMAQATQPIGATPTPVVRMGNYLEVGNDVWMKFIATGEVRLKTVENDDFEKRIRDRANGRQPDDNAAMDGEMDGMWAQLQIGIDARYQKNLQLYLLFRQQAIFDGNTVDDRANCTNPGGTDVFGRAAATENPGFRVERYWIDYKFEGTPLRMRVGADLWNVDQAGLVGDDDPRLALFGEFGNFDVMAAAVYQYAGTRIGLENDNDLWYYTFSGGYNFKPHRVQLDVVYMRDRFAGADLSTASPRVTGNGIGFLGQKIDNVLIMASWSGAFGPIRALVQGNMNVGTARGASLDPATIPAAQLPARLAVAGLPAATAAQLAAAGYSPNKHYDIFSGGVVAYVEADLGMVRPFLGVIYGSADGDNRDNKLHGFAPASWEDITQMTGVSWFSHLDTSPAFAYRDFACPARIGSTGTPLLRPRAATDPADAINTGALGTQGGGIGCAKSTGNAFNNRLGSSMHIGISTPLSGTGTLAIPVGAKLFPAKGHEVTGWYMYRAMIDSSLLEVAFAPQLTAAGKSGIGTSMYHEIGGYWIWTLNPFLDIRVSGSATWAGTGWRDLAELANCGNNTACSGDSAALKGEVRFRARF